MSNPMANAFKELIKAGVRARGAAQPPRPSNGVRVTQAQPQRRVVGGTSGGGASCCTRGR